jgi:hypothetical protein
VVCGAQASPLTYWPLIRVSILCVVSKSGEVISSLFASVMGGVSQEDQGWGRVARGATVGQAFAQSGGGLPVQRMLALASPNAIVDSNWMWDESWQIFL